MNHEQRADTLADSAVARITAQHNARADHTLGVGALACAPLTSTAAALAVAGHEYAHGTLYAFLSLLLALTGIGALIAHQEAQ